MAQRVVQTPGKPLVLHFVGHREPVFAQHDAVLDQHSFKSRALLHELLHLNRGGEPHDFLDPGTVVPRAVKNHDFSRGRQVGDVALEIPLGFFAFRRGGQRHDPGDTRREILGQPFDGAAFAGGVPAFKDDYNPGAGLLHPPLQFCQLGL